MQRNAIHWGLLALSLLCGGALYFETASSTRAQASNTPMGHDHRDVAGHRRQSVRVQPKDKCRLCYQLQH